MKRILALGVFFMPILAMEKPAAAPSAKIDQKIQDQLLMSRLIQ